MAGTRLSHSLEEFGQPAKMESSEQAAQPENWWVVSMGDEFLPAPSARERIHELFFRSISSAEEYP